MSSARWRGEKSGPAAAAAAAAATAEVDVLLVSGSMHTMSLDLDDGLGPLRAAYSAPLTDPLEPRDVAPTVGGGCSKHWLKPLAFSS